jgi:phospholipid-binding lipoprotein MlaA
VTTDSPRYCLLFALLLALAGCTTTSGPNNPQDPFENANRSIYKFNTSIDKAVLKPVAQGYRAAFPQFVRSGVNNFFGNLGQVTVIANSLFQAKFRQAGESTGRLVINTTVGVLGLIDVATAWGVAKYNEDFGQTLGYWGARPGPYVMLPFLGPSTVRDGLGQWLVDSNFGYFGYVNDLPARYGAFALDTINTRANLLEAEKVLDEAALDPYSFLRDAYLQRRERLVYDGNPPQKKLEDEDDLEESGEPAKGSPAKGEPKAKP